MGENLIITSAVNYRPEDIRVLLRSAARHIPDSAFLIFHERTDDAFRRELERDHSRIHLVRPADLDRHERLWRSARRRRKLKRMPPSRARLHRLALRTPWRAWGTAALHVVMARYFWALDAMNSETVQKADNVMLCDSRDVCVQADPFAALRGELAVGAWAVTFAERPAALEWLKARYPESVVRRVAPNPNLSNGIVLGLREAVHDFLKEMTREISQLKPHPFGQTGDQRVINALLYGSGRVPFTLAPTGGPLMAHLIQAPWEELEMRPEGLHNRSGDRICLLHHYEFHQALVEMTEREYGANAGKRPAFHPVRGRHKTGAGAGMKAGSSRT